MRPLCAIVLLAIFVEGSLSEYYSDKGCPYRKPCKPPLCVEVRDHFGCYACQCYHKPPMIIDSKKGPQAKTGVWGSWTEFGECSKTCNFGFKYRTRQCQSGQCIGDYYEAMTCAETTCSGVAATWSRYSAWSTCSTSCGVGKQYRVRRCVRGVLGHDACARGATVLRERTCEVASPCRYEGCYDHNYPWRYRGTLKIGNNGVTCLPWRRSSFKRADYPEYDLRNRFCRNPNKTLSGPWCFQNNFQTQRLCDVEICSATWRRWTGWSECTVSCGSGMRYRTRKCNGGTVDMDQCVGSVIDMQECSTNACPTPEPPVTTPQPTTPPTTTIMPTTTTMPPTTTTMPPTTIQPTTTEEPFTDGLTCISNPNPTNYIGTISHTVQGIECQEWSASSPWNHIYTPENYPNGNLVSNYCRNPDSDKWAWCITSSSSQYWDYCDVPECPSDTGFDPSETCYVSMAAIDYRGTTSVTTSGFACQFWDANSPNAHTFHSYSYPNGGLGHHNYCRAPDSATKPWCFSTNSNFVWEYCTIPVCDAPPTVTPYTVTPSQEPPNHECGYPDIPIAQGSEPGRIVGGQAANKGSIPWMADVRKNGFMHCGGSIVSERWIVTAAHCLVDTSAEYLIVVGSHSSSIVETNEKTHEVETFVAHENYNSFTIDYDIAVMKTTATIQQNSFVKPICLPPYSASHDYNVGELVLVSGWGSNLVLFPDILQQVFVPMINHDKCKMDYPGEITDRMICAGFEEGGKDSCGGDSGGPLVSLTHYWLLGVVSWGHGCAQKDNPGVYTNVALLRPWIDQHIN